MIISDGITIDAPIDRVWAAFADVERWPEWTASVTRVTPLSGPGLEIGAEFRIEQPKLRAAVWRVTGVEPGRSWTWVSRAPGIVTSARHELRPVDGSTTRVDQTIEHRGVLAPVLGRLTGRLTRRYLALEAAGLDRRARADAAAP